MNSGPKRISKYMLDDELQALIGKAANIGDKISFADLDDDLQLIIDNAGKSNTNQDELSSYASIYRDVVKRLNQLEQNAINYFNKAEDKITPQMLPASITESLNNMSGINDKASLDYVKKTYEPKADAELVHGKLNDMLQNVTSKVNTLSNFNPAALVESEVTKQVGPTINNCLKPYVQSAQLANYLDKNSFAKTDTDGSLVLNEAKFSKNVRDTLNNLNNFAATNYFTKADSDKRYRKIDTLISLDDMDESLKKSMIKVSAQADSVASASAQTIIEMYNGAIYGSTWFKTSKNSKEDEVINITKDLDNKYGNLTPWYSYSVVESKTSSSSFNGENSAQESSLYNSLNAAQKRDVKTQYIYPYSFSKKATEFADTFNMGNEGYEKLWQQNNESIPLVGTSKLTIILLCNYLYSKIQDIVESYDSVSAYVTARIGSGITGTVKDYVDSKTKISSLRSSIFGTTKISKSELDSSLQGKIDNIDTNANAISALEARVAALEAKVK